jgi:hypothetical protein
VTTYRNAGSEPVDFSFCVEEGEVAEHYRLSACGHARNAVTVPPQSALIYDETQANGAALTDMVTDAGFVTD